MGTLEAVELGHARKVTQLGHPDICYHEITNPNINLVHFSLQPKNLKCFCFVSITINHLAELLFTGDWERSSRTASNCLTRILRVS